MTNVRAFYKMWALLFIGILSSAIMLWCIWHYPVRTGIAMVLVLAAFRISAALSRVVEGADIEPATDGEA